MGLIGARRIWGSWGRAAASKCCAFKAGKKNSLALRSLRTSVVLVTPNFRENHTEERGEEEKKNAIFPGNHFTHLQPFLHTTSRLVRINRLHARRFGLVKSV